MFIPSEYKRQVSEELGDSAVYLLDFYANNYYSSDIDVTDNEQVAKAIGWKGSKVRTYKSKLVKANHIKFISNTVNKHNYKVVLITKDNVLRYKELIKNGKPVRFTAYMDSKQ